MHTDKADTIQGSQLLNLDEGCTGGHCTNHLFSEFNFFQNELNVKH